MPLSRVPSSLPLVLRKEGKKKTLACKVDEMYIDVPIFFLTIQRRMYFTQEGVWIEINVISCLTVVFIRGMIATQSTTMRWILAQTWMERCPLRWFAIHAQSAAFGSDKRLYNSNTVYSCSISHDGVKFVSLFLINLVNFGETATVLEWQHNRYPRWK